MAANPKSVIYQACRAVLRPLASMLLRVGMTWKEFSDLSKSVFVEVATAEFGIRGRPTNVSRVSILTGIGRKEVRRQRDLLGTGTPPVREKTTDATRVVSGWHQDPDFLDSNDEPLALDESGAHPSFATLCTRYSGDIAPATMLKELLKTGTVARDAVGRLIAKRRYYQPAQHDDENLLWATGLVRDLVQTMNNNVFRSDETLPRFGGKAENVDIPPSAIAAFRDYMEERGQAFLEDIDNWLTEHTAQANEGTEDRIRLGVGLFAIEDRITKEIER